MIKYRVLLVLSALALISLLTACGLTRIFSRGKPQSTLEAPTALPAAATPTAAAQPELTATPTEVVATPTAASAAEPTAAPEEAITPEVPALSESLQALRAYSIAMDYTLTTTYKDGSEKKQQFSIAVDVDKDKSAQRVSMSGTNEEGEPMAMEMITIGQDSWISFGEGWMYTKAEQAEQDLSMTEQFLGMGNDVLASARAGDIKLVGRGVNVNGVRADHYAWSSEDLGVIAGEDVNARGNGEIWVAQDGEYVVKMVTRVESAEGGLSGDEDVAREIMEMNWELKNIGQAPAIQPPEGMTSSDMIPVMEGAVAGEGYLVSQDMAIYQVKATHEEVLQWYADTLSASGWQQESQELGDQFSSAVYTKEAERLSIMVTGTEKEGIVSVMVNKETQ